MKPKAFSYVRFSTPEQLKGDSLNRQLQLSKDYAKERGLVLDETLRDEGKSAFKGHHRSEGAALGRFLKMVKKGRIPKGSFLLVESLDRLSREQYLDALDQLRDITRAGITVVTLSDRQEYTHATLNANIGQLMFSLMIMSRAHEESAMKSQRLAASWKSKRSAINSGKILTKKAPAWLRVNWLDKEQRQGRFEQIPERVATVQRIFKLYLEEGAGAIAICKQFNQEGLKPWGRSETGWHTSYVKKILKNPAVMGEFQPHRKVDGKRIPVGDPISNYYPAIIDSNTFYQVQERLASNTIYKGKTGTVSNLFGHVAKCALCGASMSFVNKGKPPKGGQYLVCDAARRGNGCQYKSIRYAPFEKGVIDYFLKLNARELLSGRDERHVQAIALRGELAGIDGEIKRVEARILNLEDQVADTADKRVREGLIKRLTEQHDRIDGLQASKASVERKLSTVEQIETATASQLSDIRELHEHMATLQGDKLKQLRLRLRARVRELIERIDVYSYGFEGDESETPKCIIRFKAGHMAVVSIHPNIIRVHGPK